MSPLTSLNSLYRQLFGKNAPKDASVVEVAEHGRAGGLSTGQGFKFTRGIDEKILIDEADENTTYIGKSKLDGNTANEEWQIRRIQVSGTVTAFSFADGSDNYDKEWDERVNYTY